MKTRILGVMTLVSMQLGAASVLADDCVTQLGEEFESRWATQVSYGLDGRFHGSFSGRILQGSVRLEHLPTGYHHVAGVRLSHEVLPADEQQGQEHHRLVLSYELTQTVEYRDTRLVVIAPVQVTRHYDKSCQFVATQDHRELAAADLSERVHGNPGIESSPDFLGRPNCHVSVSPVFTGFEKHERAAVELRKQLLRGLKKAGFKPSSSGRPAPSHDLAVSFDLVSERSCTLELELTSFRYTARNPRKLRFTHTEANCSGALHKAFFLMGCRRD